MRHNMMHVSVTTNLPTCPTCGAATSFAHAADYGRDKRVYFIFNCAACANETKVWRAEWQAMADAIVSDDD